MLQLLYFYDFFVGNGVDSVASLWPNNMSSCEFAKSRLDQLILRLPEAWNFDGLSTISE